MTKVKESSEKAKNWLDKTLGFKGYVLYIWNSELMITSLKPLSINNLPASSERFPLRQINNTGASLPCSSRPTPPSITLRTSVRKCGFTVHSGASIHATCTLPLGCPTNRNSILERTSTNTARGSACNLAQASSGKSV